MEAREVHIGFNVELEDMTFFDEMINGGISDDGTALIGDVSHTDTRNYDGSSLSEERKLEIDKKYGLDS